MKALILSIAAGVLAASVPLAASAQTVTETESNDSIGTAQNIDGHYSLASNTDITNSTTVPHVTVHGTVGFAGDQDYYKFTVSQANAMGTFDIDHSASGSDFRLALYDSTSTAIASNDDEAALDPGSTSTNDPFLTYTFNTPGTYYVRAFDAGGVVGGGYDLQVSLTSATAAPEPVSWALMILGFGMAGTILRRRGRGSIGSAPAVA